MTPPVRRFEPGASGMWYGKILSDLGYQVRYLNSNVYFVKYPRGHTKRMSQKQLTAFIDRLRLENGLEPIRKCPA